MITRTTQVKFRAVLGVVVALMIFGRSVPSLFGEDFVRGYPALIIVVGGKLLVAAVGPVMPCSALQGIRTIVF